MNKKNSNIDPLEKLIREKAQSFEAKPKANAFDQIMKESTLPSSSRGMSKLTRGVAGAVTLGVMVVSAFLILNTKPSTKPVLKESAPIINIEIPEEIVKELIKEKPILNETVRKVNAISQPIEHSPVVTPVTQPIISEPTIVVDQTIDDEPSVIKTRRKKYAPSGINELYQQTIQDSTEGSKLFNPEE